MSDQESSKNAEDVIDEKYQPLFKDLMKIDIEPFDIYWESEDSTLNLVVGSQEEVEMFFTLIRNVLSKENKSDIINVWDVHAIMGELDDEDNSITTTFYIIVPEKDVEMMMKGASDAAQIVIEEESNIDRSMLN